MPTRLRRHDGTPGAQNQPSRDYQLLWPWGPGCCRGASVRLRFPPGGLWPGWVDTQEARRRQWGSSLKTYAGERPSASYVGREKARSDRRSLSAALRKPVMFARLCAAGLRGSIRLSWASHSPSRSGSSAPASRSQNRPRPRRLSAPGHDDASPWLSHPQAAGSHTW